MKKYKNYPPTNIPPQTNMDRIVLLILLYDKSVTSPLCFSPPPIPRHGLSQISDPLACDSMFEWPLIISTSLCLNIEKFTF